MRSHLLIADLSTRANSVLFTKSSSVPVSSRLLLPLRLQILHWIGTEHVRPCSLRTYGKNYFSNKMTPNAILPYLEISSLFSHHLRSFFLQHIETHSQIVCRARQTLEHAALNAMSLSSSSPWSTGKHEEERVESQREWLTLKKRGRLNHQEWGSYELRDWSRMHRACMGLY